VVVESFERARCKPKGHDLVRWRKLLSGMDLDRRILVDTLSKAEAALRTVEHGLDSANDAWLRRQLEGLGTEGG